MPDDPNFNIDDVANIFGRTYLRSLNGSFLIFRRGLSSGHDRRLQTSDLLDEAGGFPTEAAQPGQVQALQLPLPRIQREPYVLLFPLYFSPNKITE